MWDLVKSMKCYLQEESNFSPFFPHKPDHFALKCSVSLPTVNIRLVRFSSPVTLFKQLNMVKLFFCLLVFFVLFGVCFVFGGFFYWSELFLNSSDWPRLLFSLIFFFHFLSYEGRIFFKAKCPSGVLADVELGGTANFGCYVYFL